MDSTQKTTKTKLLPLLGLGAVLLITSQCIIPFENPLSRTIASHSVYVMLGLFILGGLAFIIKKPFVMLYTWLACVALCQFLKDTPHSPFYYSTATEETRQIQIAHFVIKDKLECSTLLEAIDNLDLDLLSIQTTANLDLSDICTPQLKTKFPYRINHFNKTSGTLIFSKMRLDAADTFHCNEVPYLMSNLIIDSISKRKLQFLSLYLPDAAAENPTLMMEKLSAIGACWSTRQEKDMPLMAFGAIPAVAWSPEIRAFRSLCTLNDSRLDLELQSQSEHIFYSNHLQCLSYESLGSGIGVIGTYQLKLPSATANLEITEANPTLTQR